MAREIPGMWEYLNGGPATGKGGGAPGSCGPRMPADTGCRYSPSCLSCHLPRCYWEMTQTERRWWDAARQGGNAPELTLALYRWLEAVSECIRMGSTEEELRLAIDQVADEFRQPPEEGRP